MTKVTYLFGAGASANALPVVEKLPRRIIGLIDEIKVKNLWLPDNENFGLSNNSKKDIQLALIKDFEWLYENVNDPTEPENENTLKVIKHASVDTFAKKLFLKKDDQSLNRLKNALSMFFILEQSRVRADMRYDTFFASILNEDTSKFPENIKALSWNYDYQFEKAFSAFSDKNDLGKNQKLLNVVSKFSTEVIPPGFAIVKINGTTGYGGKAHGEPIIHNYVKDFDLNAEFDVTLFEKVAERYHLVTNKFGDSVYLTLSFAWEKSEPGESDIVEKAITCTQDTDILVVIGYSFPFFNREVDRKIIGAMKNLSKVYFQAPDAENIKTRFQAVRGKDLRDNSKDGMPYPELVAYPEVGSFLLPDEL